MSNPLDENQVNRTLKRLASMPFAIGILLLLSSVSVIGTLIAQNRSRDFYRSNYGDTWQQVIDAASLDNVYHAWWFISLLGFLFVSLVAAIWRHGTRVINNNRSLMEIPVVPEIPASTAVIRKSGSADIEHMINCMRSFGFKHHIKKSENTQQTLYFRKGQWGKLGFLPIHVGILVIISGGFVTSQFGFRGAMNIAVGESSNKVFIAEGEAFRTLELPFHIRNNGFYLDQYVNGMPSGYSSKLDAIIQNRPIVSKEIIVNDPLTIGDITVYQASFGDAGSLVNIAITDLSRPAFAIQQMDTAVHKILEDDDSGTRFTIAEFRQNNVMNLSTDPLKNVMRDLGPSVDIRLQSPADGTITYRVYKNFPHMIAFTRLGDTAMTTFNLGMSPADQKLIKLLSSYLQYSNASKEHNADSRRQAFRQAMEFCKIPMSMARDLGPVIANAAEELSKYKLPALFQLNSYEQKLYTGLQVSKDPGANIIWAGSFLLILGLLMFYISEYRVWVIINQQGETTHIKLVLSGNRKTSISLEYLMQRLLGKLQSDGFIVEGNRQ